MSTFSDVIGSLEGGITFNQLNDKLAAELEMARQRLRERDRRICELQVQVDELLAMVRESNEEIINLRLKHALQLDDEMAA